MVFTCDLLLNEKMAINPVKNKSKQIFWLLLYQPILVVDYSKLLIFCFMLCVNKQDFISAWQFFIFKCYRREIFVCVFIDYNQKGF